MLTFDPTGKGIHWISVSWIRRVCFLIFCLKIQCINWLIPRTLVPLERVHTRKINGSVLRAARACSVVIKQGLRTVLPQMIVKISCHAINLLNVPGAVLCVLYVYTCTCKTGVPYVRCPSGLFYRPAGSGLQWKQSEKQKIELVWPYDVLWNVMFPDLKRTCIYWQFEFDYDTERNYYCRTHTYHICYNLLWVVCELVMRLPQWMVSYEISIALCIVDLSVDSACHLSFTVSSAVFQSSTFGFAGILPPEYTSAVMSGQVGKHAVLLW